MEIQIVLTTIIVCLAVLTGLSVVFNWLLGPVKKDISRIGKDISRIERDLNQFKREVNTKLDKIFELLSK